MSEEKDSWAEYGKLVLKEIERLTDTQEKTRIENETKFGEINTKLGNIHNLETRIGGVEEWKNKVSDVWSPSQMKESKDELYRQKSIVSSAIAIISFIQIMIAIGLSIWGNFKK